MNFGVKIHIFSSIGKYFAYSFPNLLKTFKVEGEEKTKNAHPSIKEIFLGEKIWIKKGWGEYEFLI